MSKILRVRVLMKWQAAWLAGAIDSDGSIGLYKAKEGRIVVVQMANVCHKFLRQIRKTIGCGSTAYHIPSLSHKGRQPMYMYSLKGARRCYRLLEQITPFLIVKKQKALKIMKELETKPFGRWKQYTV
jgi:hypothetical protein